MPNEKQPIAYTLTDNTAIAGKEDKYKTITLNLDKILESWRISLFSFEWLTAEGTIRTAAELPEKERIKYEAICADIESNTALARPILGIGVMDNIEIGSRRDVLLTLRTKGITQLNVHIPKSLAEDFIPYQ